MHQELKSIVGLETQIRILLAGFGTMLLPLMKHLLKCPEKVTVAGVIPASNLKGYKALTEHPSQVEMLQLAEKHQIRILAAPGINSREFRNELSELKPHILLVGGWPEIISSEIVTMKGLISINCHGSLLPKYRGACPCVATIFNGDQNVGLTFHLIDDGIDTGDILRQRELVVENDETSLQLERRISEEFGKSVVPLLTDLKSGKVFPRKQSGIPSYVPKQQPEWGWIPWGADPKVIDQRIRALHGFIHIVTSLHGQVIAFESGRVIRTNCSAGSHTEESLIGPSTLAITRNVNFPGEVLANLPDKIMVATRDPAVHVELDKPEIVLDGTDVPHIRTGDRFLSIACSSILKSA